MLLSRSSEQRCPRHGAVAVLVAVCLTVMLGIVALALDGGLLLQERRRTQATADAAALAAAVDLFQNFTTNQGLDVNGTAKRSALTAATAHGYLNDGSNSVVTVRVPNEVPSQSCPAPITNVAGRLNPGFVEVTLEFKQKRAFSSLFGSDDIPVRARAVAQGSATPSTTPGVILLEPKAEFPLKVSGNGTLRVPTCSVIVNSTHARTFQHSGNGPVEAKEWNLTGDPGYVGSGNGTITGPINRGVPPTPDPLRHLPPPDPASLPLRSDRKTSISSNQDVVLQPGVYRGGIQISGNGKVILAPGIYYLEGGGFQLSGNGDLVAEGVMLYNASGKNGTSADKIQISGNGAVTMSPPTAGPYTGISIFQERTLGLELYISGNGKTNISGTVYAANAMSHVSGNGNVSVQDRLGSQYITRTMQLSGNGNILIDIPAGARRANLRIMRLVD